MSTLIARSVLETVAKALAEAHDVRVVFYGDECHTDGKTITLPSLPDKIPEDMILMLRGYLDHEVGHIAFTDFKAYRKLPKNKTEQFALNAIEDIRIELAMENIWKGCKVNFERAHDYTTDKIINPDKRRKKTAVKWEDYDAVTKIFILFISAARYGFDVPILADHSIEYMPIIDEMAYEIDETQTLESTEEAYELAVRVLDKIEHIARDFDRPMARKRAKTKPSEGAKSSGGKPGGTGSAGIGTGSSDGSGVEAPKKGPKGKAKKPEIAEEESGSTKDVGPIEEESEDSEEGMGAGSEDSDGEGSGSEDGESGGSGSEEDEGEDSEGSGSESEEEEPEEEDDPAVKEEILERLRESLEKDDKKILPDMGKEISKKTGSLKGYRILTSEKDTFLEWPGTKAGLEEYEIFRKRTHGVVGVLKTRLNRLLMSKKRASWLGGKRHGIMNPATLHMAAQRTSDKLYRMRKEGDRINTAVTILVDLSGSMSGERMRKATETSVLMAETLSLANIPFEILGFSGDNTYSSRRDGGYGTKFSRYGSLDMFYFKMFTEGLNQITKKRIGSMRAMRQNYDGESVRFAANRLMTRGERKKVMFVLSDGAPAASHCDSYALSPHLKQVCTELEALSDFFLCGFGIQTNAPKEFYRNHVLIDDLKDLPRVLMENLSKAIL